MDKWTDGRTDGRNPKAIIFFEVYIPIRDLGPQVRSMMLAVGANAKQIVHDA